MNLLWHIHGILMETGFARELVAMVKLWLLEIEQLKQTMGKNVDCFVQVNSFFLCQKQSSLDKGSWMNFNDVPLSVQRFLFWRRLVL